MTESSAKGSVIGRQEPSHATQPANVDKPHPDPVCGMKVAANPEKSTVLAGRAYYFCSTTCLQKFTADPDHYLHPAGAAITSVAPATNRLVYTCPMHPEIRQVGPGNCPICGMALEPLDASLVAEDTSELQDMTRRFWVSLALALPLLVLTMSEFIPGLDLHHRLGVPLSNWLQALLA
ncbi:MAG: heavy metal-binding domain-containing protein, partial [Burkholderiales bacterium]